MLAEAEVMKRRDGTCERWDGGRRAGGGKECKGEGVKEVVRGRSAARKELERVAGRAAAAGEMKARRVMEGRVEGSLERRSARCMRDGEVGVAAKRLRDGNQVGNRKVGYRLNGWG